jgi:hypothetical protein
MSFYISNAGSVPAVARKRTRLSLIYYEDARLWSGLPLVGLGAAVHSVLHTHLAFIV